MRAFMRVFVTKECEKRPRRALIAKEGRSSVPVTLLNCIYAEHVVSLVLYSV